MNSNSSDQKPYKHTIAGMRPWVYWSIFGALQVSMIVAPVFAMKYVANRTIEQLEAGMKEIAMDFDDVRTEFIFRRISRNMNDFAEAKNYVSMDEQYEKMYAGFVHLHATAGLTPPVRKEHLESEKIQPEVLYREAIDIVVATSELENPDMRVAYTRMALDNIEFGKESIPVPSNLEQKLAETTQMAKTILEVKAQ